jgi:hypothetical protein
MLPRTARPVRCLAARVDKDSADLWPAALSIIRPITTFGAPDLRIKAGRFPAVCQRRPRRPKSCKRAGAECVVARGTRISRDNLSFGPRASSPPSHTCSGPNGCARRRLAISGGGSTSFSLIVTANRKRAFCRFNSGFNFRRDSSMTCLWIPAGVRFRNLLQSCGHAILQKLELQYRTCLDTKDRGAPIQRRLIE